MKISRKKFITGLGLATLASKSSFALPISLPAKPLTIGLASYTLRKYTLDQVIDICQRLDIKDVALKSMHMPLESSDEELKAISSKMKAAGLNMYGAGVIYMKTEAEVEKAFYYAQTAGLKMIIGVPNHELLPFTEKMVKETNVMVAIHNHGPGDKVYPTPETVYEKIKNLDKRIGLCIDIGHVQRLGMDPIASILKYGDRMYDMHFKDVDGNEATNQPTQIGRGVIDVAGVLTALKKINYTGFTTVEYEKDADHAEAGLAESIGYLRALLAMKK